MIRHEINNAIKKDFKFVKKQSKNTETYIFDDRYMLIVIYNNVNIFKIDRKNFENIEKELLPYAFLLVEENRKNMYFMKYKEPNNELRKAFDCTQKNEIYFGKQILQNKISFDDLRKKIEEIENI